MNFHFTTERSLVESAKDLRANLQNASEDITTLYSKIGIVIFSYVNFICKTLTKILTSWEFEISREEQQI